MPSPASRLARRSASVVLGALALLAITPQALATDITDIGFVDQAAISSLRPFMDAQAAFAQFRQGLNGEFQRVIRGKSPADQQKVFQDFNQRVARKQHELFDPLLQRAQFAIAAVAANKTLSVVVDKTIVIFGGQDVTRDVLGLMAQPGPVVPPINTPPPGVVGYVDQTQLDTLPNIKKANDEFMQFRQKLGGQLNQQLAGKPDDQKRQIVASFNQQLQDEQRKTLQPIIDQTNKVVSEVARKKKLILVVDASDRVYGGVDVTADVVSALK